MSKRYWGKVDGIEETILGIILIGISLAFAAFVMFLGGLSLV